MAKAQNELEVLRQVDQWIAVAKSYVQAMDLMEKVIDQDVAVGQTWNDVVTDFPDLLDATGAFKNQTFTPSEIQSLENNAKKLLGQFDKVTPADPPTADLNKIFRQISGVV
jgi:hypothetical protein